MTIINYTDERQKKDAVNTAWNAVHPTFKSAWKTCEAMTEDESFEKYGVGFEAGWFVRFELENGLIVWVVNHGEEYSEYGEDGEDFWCCFIENADGHSIVEGQYGPYASEVVKAAYERYMTIIDESGTNGVYADEAVYIVSQFVPESGWVSSRYVSEFADALHFFDCTKRGLYSRSDATQAKLEREQYIYSREGVAKASEVLLHAAVKRAE